MAGVANKQTLILWFSVLVLELGPVLELAQVQVPALGLG